MEVSFVATVIGVLRALVVPSIVGHIPLRRAEVFPRRHADVRRGARLTAGRVVTQGNAGMSLLEILITLAALGVISLIMYAFFATQYKMNVTSENVAAQREVAMYAMKALVRDIRMAGYGNTTSEDITQADSSSVTFRMYNDATSTLNTIKYSYSGTALQKNGSTLFPNLLVQSLHFSYYDASDTEITSGLTSATVRATIRKIRLQLEAQAEAGAADVGIRPPVTLRSEVKLRNVR